MSVIFGMCNFNGEPVHQADLLKMQERLNHWQADQVELSLHNSAGLGHLMLYNTPQSLTERLPYYDTDSQLAITADARLDNRTELIKKLGLGAHRATSIADSLLILKAYEKYAFDCVKHLVGDFAFAIYDHIHQRLFCGRDHLGVKPFFYSHTNSHFVFASEKKGILALPNADRSINKQFLFNHVVTAPEQNLEDTLYQNIKRLKPAHYLVVNIKEKNCIYERYWLPDVYTELKFSNKDEYYEGLRHHFEQAVQCRTVSAYNIGVELSGGMDSSAITGAANTHLTQHNKSLITLSNTLDENVTDPNITRLDERRFIDAVIKYYKIAESLYITQTAFDDAIEEIRFGNEVNDGLERWNPLWQIPLKKAAKEHGIRTLLSGFPGDELVTYRGKYYFLDYLDKKQYLKYITAKKKYPGFNKIEPLLPFNFRYKLRQLKYGLGIFQPSSADSLNIYNIPAQYKKHLRDSIWLDPLYQEQFNSYRHFQRYRILKPQVTHRLESETRYGIYFRTEPRFPMADIRLIQYYLSMPNELKYEGEMARTAYRKAIGKYLPTALLQRDDKFGSVAPFLNVSKRESANAMQALVAQLPDFKLLNKNNFSKTTNGIQKVKKDLSADVLLWLVDNKDWLKDL